VSSLHSLSKDNEELRAYIEILKAALDNKALQLGLGSQKGFILRELETVKHRYAETQKQFVESERKLEETTKNLEKTTNDLNIMKSQLEVSTAEEKKLRRQIADFQYFLH
jgi:CHASE3 domain sensor protein